MGQRDVRSMGRSKIVPFVEGEHAKDRHERRLRVNLETGRVEVEEWCKPLGVTLEIKNGGHHWIFRRDNWIAEWWPSSAKLVVGRSYGRGIHAHDWQQVTRLLSARLRKGAR